MDHRPAGGTRGSPSQKENNHLRDHIIFYRIGLMLGIATQA
jgi:hypothetical protein